MPNPWNIREFARANRASNLENLMNKAAAVAAGVVVLLGAGYLGATAWTGQQAEGRYRQQLAQVQVRLPFVSITEQKYDKRFFASTSTTTLQFGCPTVGAKPPPTATITSTIRHGPVAGGTLAAAVVDSQLRIGGGDADAQRLIAAFGNGVPLTVRTVVDLGGRSRSTFMSPAARLPLGAAGEFVWQGLSGDMESGPDGRSVVYRLKSPGLTLTDPAHQVSVRFGALAFQGDGQAITPAGPLMVGRVQGTLDAMEVSGGAAGESAKAVFSGLAFTSSTALDGELIGGTASFNGAGAIGDVKLDKIEMKVSMKRLHAPTYQRLMETANKELYRCDSPGMAANLIALQAKMEKDLLALLQHGPQMSLDRLAVESGGQTAELSYAFGIEGVTEADSKQPLPALLMTRAHVRAATRLPLAWVRKLSQAGPSRLKGGIPDPATLDVMLEQAQARGYVIRDGDYVKAEMALADGMVTVNGKPLGAK